MISRTDSSVFRADTEVYLRICHLDGRVGGSLRTVRGSGFDSLDSGQSFSSSVYAAQSSNGGSMTYPVLIRRTLTAAALALSLIHI